MSPTERYKYFETDRTFRARGLPDIVLPPLTYPPERADWTRGDRPSMENRGVAGIGNPELIPYAVGSTSSASNLTLVNRYIDHEVSFTGSNVHLIGCKIDGKLGLKNDASATDCTMWRYSGSGQRNVSVVRCAMEGELGEDGVYITSDSRLAHDVLIQDCYVGMKGPLQPGQHYDGIQVRGGHRIDIIGNYFDSAPLRPVLDGQGNPTGEMEYYSDSKITAAVYIENAYQDKGGIDVVRIQGNWMRCGNIIFRPYGNNIAAYDNILYNDNPPSSVSPLDINLEIADGNVTEDIFGVQTPLDLMARVAQ